MLLHGREPVVRAGASPGREVVELCRTTPAARLERVGRHSPEARTLVIELATLYGEFLDSVRREEKQLLEAFANEGYRREAFDRARLYGQRLYELLVVVTPPERLRYLVV